MQLVDPIMFVPLLLSISCRQNAAVGCRFLLLGDIDDYFSRPVVCRIPYRTANVSHLESGVWNTQS